MHELDGQAKAMVVTGSREEAFRYHRAIDAYIKDKGYPHSRGRVLRHIGSDLQEASELLVDQHIGAMIDQLTKC